MESHTVRPKVYMHVRLWDMWDRPRSCCLALLGPTFPEQFRLTAQSGYGWSPTLLHFSFSLWVFFFFLRLPLFHTLSSHNTVGGGELVYLVFLWAPLSEFHPLSSCRTFPSLPRYSPESRRATLPAWIVLYLFSLVGLFARWLSLYCFKLEFFPL